MKSIFVDILKNVGIIFITTFFIKKLYANKNKKMEIEGKFNLLHPDKSLFWLGIIGVILVSFTLSGWYLSGQLQDDIKENSVKFLIFFFILLIILFFWLASYGKFHKIKYNEEKIISYGIFKIKTLKWDSILKTKFIAGGEIVLADNSGISITVGNMLTGFSEFLNYADSRLNHLESWSTTLERIKNHKI